LPSIHAIIMTTAVMINVFKNPDLDRNELFLSAMFSSSFLRNLLY